MVGRQRTLLKVDDARQRESIILPEDHDNAGDRPSRTLRREWNTRQDLNFERSG